MASTLHIASPTPQSHTSMRSRRKDLLQAHEDGRGTPLPKYEKTQSQPQSVPFTLTLQEEKDRPGQFQLVVNVDPGHSQSQSQPEPTGDTTPKPSASKKLVATLREAPSLGYDVSPLYQTQKSSPPATPQDDRQGWSDLDAIHPDFLQKVVPDWKVTFSRSDSTASSQSRKLADIKARIKKSGKGFVVRLLKGANPDTDHVAEVHLGQQADDQEPSLQELDSLPRAELDAAETTVTSPVQSTVDASDQVFEIGSSGELGVQRPAPPQPATARFSSVPSWLNQVATESRRPTSVLDEGFNSDAETLLPDVPSIADRLEEQTDVEPFSRNSSLFPTRSGSVSSIVKTPTRGLSVVGPVKRVEKVSRVRAKGKSARSDLNRSGACKSIKRRSPSSCFQDPNLTRVVEHVDKIQSSSRSRQVANTTVHTDSSDDLETTEYSVRPHPAREHPPAKTKTRRRLSAEELAVPTRPKARLRLQTNVPPSRSANTSPVTRRKRSPRSPKPAASSSSVSFADEVQSVDASPVWSEVDPSDDLREALEKAFLTATDVGQMPTKESISIPIIEEPVSDEPISDGAVGEIALPPELEIRSAPSHTKNPIATFWALALRALSGKVFEGAKALHDQYGSEPPVPANHVRVRWTCSCGEFLYDDFIERRPGAARLLEAFLNRPRAHTPNSPHSRTSTSTSMSSVFDSVSRTSTLATPASTYGGPSSWGKGSGSSKYSPTRVLSSNSSFNVRIAEESWLLTCANEGRFTPKIVHIDVNAGKIKSDKDLALALREHYERLNRRWLNWARLRGLTTIEFVQFEVHRNRFADIRAAPSMPPSSSSTNEKSPSHHPYTFEPVDLVPPVGSAYLLHLFKHPEDYDGELITYSRAPKRRERLEVGMGWGINLVEGFLAQKVWTVVMACFGIGSAVFAVLWTIRMGDVQGAFGVAGWVVTLAGLVLGGLQAWLE